MHASNFYVTCPQFLNKGYYKRKIWVNIKLINWNKTLYLKSSFTDYIPKLVMGVRIITINYRETWFPKQHTIHTNNTLISVNTISLCATDYSCKKDIYLGCNLRRGERDFTEIKNQTVTPELSNISPFPLTIHAPRLHLATPQITLNFTGKMS